MIYTIDQLKKRILPVAQKHDLRAVFIFGSYARNEASEESDVDILIDREGSSVRTLFDIGGLYNELCESIGKEVDLLTTQALFEESTRERTPWFFDQVLLERLVIYERDEKI